MSEHPYVLSPTEVKRDDEEEEVTGEKKSGKHSNLFSPTEVKRDDDEEEEGAGEKKSGKITKSSCVRKRKISKVDLTALVSIIASATSLSHRFLSQNDLLLHPSQTLTLESSIKSTAFAISKILSLSSLQTLTLEQKPTSPIPSPPSPSSWFHRFLSSSDSDSDSDSRFLETFRISKRSFHLLLQTLSPSLQSSATSPESTLAAALFRLAHAAPYKSVGRRFGLDSAAACRAFYIVCKAITDRLAHLFNLPTFPDGHFTDRISLPNCCGVLSYSRFFTDRSDGTVIVQGLVDADGRFLDISAGWPGLMAPDVILRQTKLYSRLTESKELLNGAAFNLADGNSIGPYVLGDYCCPLLAWLLTPFPKSREIGDNSHRLFNSVHERGMGLANNAFGSVLARWRLLSTRWKQECLDFLPFIVVAGCLLHNFLIDCREPALEDIGDYIKEQRFPECDRKEDESGERARDALALHLSMASQRK